MHAPQEALCFGKTGRGGAWRSCWHLAGEEASDAGGCATDYAADTLYRGSGGLEEDDDLYQGCEQRHHDGHDDEQDDAHDDGRAAERYGYCAAPCEALECVADDLVAISQVVTVDGG